MLPTILDEDLIDDKEVERILSSFVMPRLLSPIKELACDVFASSALPNGKTKITIFEKIEFLD